MPEKTKPGEKDRKNKEKANETITEKNKDMWENDQREKSYYYDDAHGYEIYKPDEDEEEE